MNDFQELTNKINKFREERDWFQFHKPKDCALTLCLEAAELLELFQWKDDLEVEEFIKNNKEKLSDEMIDVLYWILVFANDCDIDIKEAFERKMKRNAEKYPVEKSKGNKKKYTEL